MAFNSIYNVLINSINKLWNKKPIKLVSTSFSEDLAKRDKVISLQQNKIQTYESQLSEIKAKENQKKQKVKEIDVQKQITEKLEEERKELRRKKFKNSVDLRNFFASVGYTNKPTKLGKKIEVMSRDGDYIFGLLGGFHITPGGYMAITDNKGNLLSYGRNISQIIFKPDGLGNQLKMNKIFIPYDKDHNYLIDTEEAYMPDVIWDENKQDFVESQERLRRVKEMIIEKEREIFNSKKYSERVEAINISLKRQLDDSMRALKLAETSEHASKTEVSKILDRFMRQNSLINDLQLKVVTGQQFINIKDKMVESLVNINEDLLEKAEELGVKTNFERVQTNLMKTIEWAKLMTPERIEIKSEEAREEEPITMPGQPMGKSMERPAEQAPKNK